MVLVFGLPVQAHAQSDVTKAQALNREGTAAYRAKDYALALEKFKAANALVPNPTFDVNIGRCHEKLGQFAQALVHCKIALNATSAIGATRATATQAPPATTPTPMDRASSIFLPGGEDPRRMIAARVFHFYWTEFTVLKP